MTDQLPVHDSGIRYPFGLPEDGWRRAVKIGLGRTLLAPRPRYGRLLLAGWTRLHGGEFSFCHNHPHLLGQAGWDVVDQYETEVSGMRFLTITARKTGK